MSRFETMMAVIARGPRGLAARGCTALGFLAVMLAVAVAPQVAQAVPPSAPEIDPMSIGSVAGVVVGALALLEGRVLRRRKDR
jgi:hypothetical protein